MLRICNNSKKREIVITYESSQSDSATKWAVWAGAIGDILLVAPLATPPTALFHLHTLDALNAALGMSGGMQEFLPIHMLLTNFVGIAAIVWIVYRFLFPVRSLLIGDFWVRTLFGLLLVWYYFRGDVADITGLLGVYDFFFAAAYLWVLRWNLNPLAKANAR